MIGIGCYIIVFIDCVYSIYVDPHKFHKLRVFMKCSILSFCHYSPLYLFASALCVDFLAMLMEYRITIKNKLYPKLWLFINFVILMDLGLLVLLPESITVVIIVSLLVVLVIVIEAFIHYR